MEARDFVYWLQGFSEVTDKVPTKEQWKIIQDHLSLVFNKITPDRRVQEVPLPGIQPFIPTTPGGFPFDNLPTTICSADDLPIAYCRSNDYTNKLFCTQFKETRDAPVC